MDCKECRFYLLVNNIPLCIIGEQISNFKRFCMFFQKRKAKIVNKLTEVI